MSLAGAINPNPQHTINDGAPGTGLTVAAGNWLPQDEEFPFDPDELLTRIQEWYKGARDHWQEWLQEASMCFDFRAGHQWDEDDLNILRDQNRPAITFNRIGPFMDSVQGLEINNRQETQYLPRQLGSQGVNDLLTSTAQWVRQECDAEDEETDAFLDAITCGIGVVQTRMDYDDDPDGMIKMERIDPLEVLPDPTSRKQNFADARRIHRHKDLLLDDARSLFPDVPEQDLHAQWAEDTTGVHQPHNARLAPYYRIDQSGEIDRQTMMCRLVEVEWWDYETAYRVFDPTNGRLVRLSAKDMSRYLFRARALGIKVSKPIKDRRKCYYKAIVGNRVLRQMRGADEGGFSYKFITAKRDRNKGTWYGIVRAMIDPQMWANKWLSQSLHIVNTNAKGGLLAEEDAFVDPEEAKNDWASADSITMLTPGGLNKVKSKDPPQFPAAITSLMEFAVASIPQVTGINPELMGQSTSNQPQAAVLEMGRKQQGMAILAGLFNAKRRYQKEQGRLLLWMMQEFIADGRLVRIGGPEQQQYVRFFKDPALLEYDVIVDDAPTSPNTKERVWAALMGLFPVLARVPPQFLGIALKYAPVPASFANEAQQVLAQPPPVAPDKQAAAALAQARAEHLKAETQHVAVQTQGAPAKYKSEVDERNARIESLRAQAIASLAKSGIDSEDMKFQHIMQTVDALLRSHAQGHDTAMQHVQRGDQLAAQAADREQAAQEQQSEQTAPAG